MHMAQTLWAARPIRGRLRVLRAARHELARLTPGLAAAISPGLARTPADTRVAEILPLLAACRFLEQRAAAILAPRKLGRRGLPFWLAGVDSEVHRVPLGRVLVIGPANYPIFLPGVQALQALAAGNAVTWKPGTGGRAVAEIFAEALGTAGLPDGLLRIADESVEAAQTALAEHPAKVFFTGSASTGRIIFRQLAETLTPSVMELSGCDAVVVLPSADLARVAQALAFGLRLNGSATCMAPRRVLLVDATAERREAFLAQLRAVLVTVPGPQAIDGQLQSLLDDTVRQHAHIEGGIGTPILVTHAHSAMRIAQADIFAPVLAVIEVLGVDGVIEAQQTCPFDLTVSIFGDEATARRLAACLDAGTVLINDLIVPTADPRLPFGGRRQSGFGVTRGAEGLLEMTAVQSIAVRRGRGTRHYEATTATHEGLFDGLIAAAHAGTWAERWQGLQQVVAAGKQLSKKQ
jgi:aldehyde dehydrogenase (NAD+)